MGMIGYFAEIDSEKINQLLESTEKPLMDNIHDTLSGLRRLDIDKRWDFLHFGLTGTSAFDPAKNDPLSRAVLGEHSLEDGIDGFLGLTWNQELAATIDRLESLDRSELRKQFSIKRLNEMEIYPGVTFSEELEGQLFASIMLDMEKLISAYRRMLRQGNHALTVIVWVMVSERQKNRRTCRRLSDLQTNRLHQRHCQPHNANQRLWPYTQHQYQQCRDQHHDTARAVLPV